MEAEESNGNGNNNGEWAMRACAHRLVLAGGLDARQECDGDGEPAQEVHERHLEEQAPEHEPPAPVQHQQQQHAQHLERPEQVHQARLHMPSNMHCRAPMSAAANRPHFKNGVRECPTSYKCNDRATRLKPTAHANVSRAGAKVTTEYVTLFVFARQTRS